MGERTLEKLKLGGACPYGSSNPRKLALERSGPVPSACRLKPVSIRAKNTKPGMPGFL